MNIVLIGYRGTGKSVVGKLTASGLGMKCIAMDEMIIEKAGMPIPEIVKISGWTRFRDLESEIVRELSVRDNLVIDTGGGVIERPENITALRANSVIIWLKASVETIVKRIEKSSNRPALTEGKSFTDEVSEVLARRTPMYQSSAEYEIDTDQSSPQQIAEQIIKIARKK